MQSKLELAKNFVLSSPKLKTFQVRLDKDELYLSREGDLFARLIPEASSDKWRMEYFRNLEEWVSIDFAGTLEECLEFLADSRHYQFWEG